MAARLPLVINAGVIEQLQSGDSLNAPITQTDLWVATNADTVTFTIGMPVYVSGADAAKRGLANAYATAVCIGLVNDTSIAAGSAGNIAVSGRLVATTAQWDAVVTGESGGLTPNSIYYVDPANVGKLTTVAPTTTGQVVQPMGTALSSTEMNIMPRWAVQL